MPAGDGGGEGVHGLAVLAEGPVAFGVEADLADGTGGLLDVQDDVGGAGEHAGVAGIGAAFELDYFFTAKSEAIDIAPINELVGADPQCADVVLDEGRDQPMLSHAAL